MPGRLLAIGDIHGCLRHLEALLSELAPRPEDTIIFLGDYVDRGENSSGVIERLIAVRRQCQAVFIKGNHEEFMLHARHDADVRAAWMRYGGDKTIASYGGAFPASIPEEHWQFLAAAIDWHETKSWIFTHAPIQADLPVSEQKAEDWRWSSVVPTQPHGSGKWIVCGHCNQQDGLPRLVGGTILLDTWACGGQWLSALDLSDGEVTQASGRGELRRLAWSSIAGSHRAWLRASPKTGPSGVPRHGSSCKEE